MGANASAFKIAAANRPEAKKTALVTGASSGIGLATVSALAANNWKIICAVRDGAKMEQALLCESMEVRDNCEIRILDLTKFSTVKQFAETLPQDLKIDALVCNAGMLPWKFELTEDGNEQCFQACHLSHHLLVRLLEGKLANNSRVVFVSSMMHSSAKEYEWPTEGNRGFCSNTKHKSTTGLYAQAKLANIHDAWVWGKRLSGKGVKVFSLHPGVVNSGIYPWYLRPFTKLLFVNSDQGAAPTLHCVTDVALEKTYKEGMYFYPSSRGNLPHAATPSKLARNERVADRLWVETEKIVAPFL